VIQGQGNLWAGKYAPWCATLLALGEHFERFWRKQWGQAATTQFTCGSA
jgi:hypothetical protein